MQHWLMVETLVYPHNMVSCKVYFGRHLHDFTSLILGLKSKPFFEMVTHPPLCLWNMTHYFLATSLAIFYVFWHLPGAYLALFSGTIFDVLFYFFYLFLFSSLSHCSLLSHRDCSALSFCNRKHSVLWPLRMLFLLE